MREIIKVLHGHTSHETAYVQQCYPYGWSLKTERRVWLEFKAGKGFRFVSNTRNPKKEGHPWNKEKWGTYSEVGVMVIVKSEESPTGEEVTWVGLSLYDNAEKVAKFETAYAEAIAADANVRKAIDNLKLYNRISEARSKLNRIFENAVKYLESVPTFYDLDFIKLFEGDDHFGCAIAEKWAAQTEGVGNIKDWVRTAFKEVMDGYHVEWEKAKASKPDGYKLLSPRMDTIQADDLRYFPPYIPEWGPVTAVGNGAGMIGQIVQSGGGFWARKKNT